MGDLNERQSYATLNLMDPQNIPTQPQSQEPVIIQPHRPFLLPLIISGLLLILIVGVGGFYLGKQSKNNKSDTNIITVTPTQQMSNNSSNFLVVPNLAKKQFSDPNYPQLVITYGEDWNLNVIRENSPIYGSEIKLERVKISLTKNGLILNYNISSGLGGGEPTCYLTSELKAEAVGDKWARIYENNTIYYGNDVFLKDRDNAKFIEIAEMLSKGLGKNIADYGFCLYQSDKYSSILTATTFDLPKNMQTDQVKKFPALVIIHLTGNINDQSLIKEADDIVTSTKF